MAQRGTADTQTVCEQLLHGGIGMRYGRSSKSIKCHKINQMANQMLVNLAHLIIYWML